MVVTIHISILNTSGQPIYDQIYSQIKHSIISGTMTENEALPSIRALAKDLRISVITTKRAYEELERDGLIYTIAGKGCFVARQNTEAIQEIYLRKIEEHMEEIKILAASCNLSNEDLIKIFQTLN